jgi:pyruvate-formate lyase-activating enzyme
MIDCVKIIADRISADIPVALYTVGGDTFSVTRALKHRFGLKPVAVCDRDTAKQGRAYRGLDGVPVMSFEEANSRFPGAEYFISSMDYRFDIMGELVCGNKIQANRILNWEPIEKRKSCVFFEKSIFVKANGNLIFCCVPDSPTVKFNTDTNQYANDFLKLRNELIQSCVSGKLLPPCKNCGYLIERWYPDKPASWWINWFASGICNFKCAYCSSTHTAQETKDLPLEEVIHAFKEIGMLSDFYSIILSTSGEPTLNPNRKEFYDSFDGYGCVVNTNGSVFDEDLFDLMQVKFVRLIVSLDAGTRETYFKIKGVDCIENVHRNLKRYSEALVGLVVPKYIVTPSVNDSDTDADGFVALCDALDVPYAIIAYDQNGTRPIPQNSAYIMRKIKKDLESLNILCVPYTPYETYEYVAALNAVLS